MKMIRSLTKSFFVICTMLCIALFGLIFYLENTLSKDYKIVRGEELSIASVIPINVEYRGLSASKSVISGSVGEEFEAELKIFGKIPFSTVNVEVIDETHVAVLGTPFGMKLYTDGVLVIDLTDVSTPNGNINPAKLSDIREGDYICTADGLKITCNEDLVQVVSESGGKAVTLEMIRNGKKIKKSVTPVFSDETESYKIGIWVRDSSAGIGTLTFYSPATNTVCGLGHAICDEDTGEILTVQSGEMVKAKIVSCQKGEKGAPGELKGSLLNERLAEINLNCEKGVYGLSRSIFKTNDLTEIALKQEVVNGNAQILCTVDGEKPTLYSCTVKKKTSALYAATQNFTVTVTDPVLIEKTGGIVQGMSGSPIIQNGKLIGALTHVLIDDPEKGYAIFAENMLETAQSVAENNKLKDAS